MTGLWAWIAAGALGALGAVARFVIDAGIGRRVPGDMPWGTLTVNLIGALAVGILVSAGLDGEGRFLVVGGLLGSFTTFSTWMFETQRLAEEGEGRLAALNIVVSVVLGLAAVALGWWIGSLRVSAEALKLVVHLGEGSRIGGRLACDAAMDMLGAAGVASAVLLRGAEGFGGHHRLRTDRLLSLSEDLPLVLVAVNRAERIVPVADELARALPSGLLVLERARLPGRQLDDDTFGGVGGGEAKLTVYCARPEAEGLGRVLRAAGLAGAIGLAGVDGVVLGERRRGRVLSRNREVPAFVMGVGPHSRIAQALPRVRAAVGRHVATLERVSIVRRDGAAVGPLPVVPPEDDAGLGLWQRLIVVGGEQDGPGGRPLHVGLIRELRAAGAPGATALRGSWAHTADGAGHADRLLSVRRRGPVLVSVIARPAEMARLFPIVERATARAGLVTCELLPAVRVTPAEGPARGGLRLARTGR